MPLPGGMAEANDIERHVSPDGRLVLERHLAYDPADLHEIAPQLRAVVLDAASGATLIDLRRFNGGSQFAWTADGGLELDAVNGVRIVVAPGGGSWSTGADGGLAHPIAEAEARLAVLLAPRPRRYPLTPAQRWERLKDIGAALLAVAAVVYIIWG
jgi:hypothetical protein